RIRSNSRRNWLGYAAVVRKRNATRRIQNPEWFLGVISTRFRSFLGSSPRTQNRLTIVRIPSMICSALCLRRFALPFLRGGSIAGIRHGSISKAFLVAPSQIFPWILQSDGDKLITMLLDQQQVVSLEEESIESLENHQVRFLGEAIVVKKAETGMNKAQFWKLESMPNCCSENENRWKNFKDDETYSKPRRNALFVEPSPFSSTGFETFTNYRIRVIVVTTHEGVPEEFYGAKACEELFSNLISGIAKIAVARGGQPLGLQSVFKTSCEIIESGWAKDRALVDTFIIGLASVIRERNDDKEQADREKQVRLLADLNELAVDRWGRVKVAEEPTYITVKEDNNLERRSLLMLLVIIAWFILLGVQGDEESSF
ncbi:unnamed protein product, partial [Thlaspi arvense]